MSRLMIGYAIGYAVAIGVVVVLSGCTGFEVGGKLGLYRVDEHQESTRAYRKAVPLKCYFVNCEPEVQGS